MRRNKYHAFVELRHTETGRQTLTHTQAIMTPCSRSSPGLSARLTPLGHDRQVTLHPHPRSISLAIKPTKTRGKEGVGREEGLCIFLYLWQIAVLAWFKLPMEIPTSQPAQIHRMPVGPPTQVGSQPVSLCSLPTTSQKPSILLRVGVLWFPLKCGLQDHVVSNYGLSPRQIPHLGLYFHTLTAQPPLMGCENITVGQPDRNTGKGVVSQKRSMGHLHTH